MKENSNQVINHPNPFNPVITKENIKNGDKYLPIKMHTRRLTEKLKTKTYNSKGTSMR